DIASGEWSVVVDAAAALRAERLIGDRGHARQSDRAAVVPQPTSAAEGDGSARVETVGRVRHEIRINRGGGRGGIVEQRTARVPGVEGDMGPDEVHDAAVERHDGAAAASASVRVDGL